MYVYLTNWFIRHHVYIYVCMFVRMHVCVYICMRNAQILMPRRKRTHFQLPNYLQRSTTKVSQNLKTGKWKHRRYSSLHSRLMMMTMVIIMIQFRMGKRCRHRFTSIWTNRRCCQRPKHLFCATELEPMWFANSWINTLASSIRIIDSHCWMHTMSMRCSLCPCPRSVRWAGKFSIDPWQY